MIFVALRTVFTDCRRKKVVAVVTNNSSRITLLAPFHKFTCPNETKLGSLMRKELVVRGHRPFFVGRMTTRWLVEVLGHIKAGGSPLVGRVIREI